MSAQVPPQYGNYGPLNYRSQGVPSDPFQAMDNYINYQQLVEAQRADQYTQNLSLPPDMSQHQMFLTLTQSKYRQYRDASSQEQMMRMYQRKLDIQRETYAGNLLSQSIGFGGMAAGIGFLGLGGAALTLPVTASLDTEIRRRQFAANLSTDLDLYRRRIGGDFSYQQNSMLGRQLQREMYAGKYVRPGETGSFFNSEQQMSIMKTGLSTGLLTAQNQDVDKMMTRNGGKLDANILSSMRSSGTTKQFAKNFEMLRDTTKEVVQLLQTTLEGGMSVIKELQQTGFKSIGEIRNQVMQAKAFGDISGLGTQNMMLVGRAGSLAVQGTGWAASTGASMFQYSATTAALQAQQNPEMSRAVARVGGIANAGSILGANKLNILNTGMGTRIVASMMNANGTLNPEMLDKLSSGQLSGYSVTSRASAVGMGLGIGGRAMFPLTKQKMFESLNDFGKDMVTQRAFDLWRGPKGGNVEQQAFVFAQLTNPNASLAEQEVIQQSLLTSKNTDQKWAARQTISDALQAKLIPQYRNPWSRAMGNRMVDIGQASARFGNAMMNGPGEFISQSVGAISKFSRWMPYQVSELAEWVTGTKDQGYGTVSRFPICESSKYIK